MSRHKRDSFLLFAALTLSSALADASPSFSTDLKDALHIAKAPDCSICHRETSSADASTFGDAGADLPFAEALVDRGLIAGNDDSLRAALATMTEVDSDGDGARDLDELSWGGDPNHAYGPEIAPSAPPSYGCSVRGSAARKVTSFPAAAICAAILTCLSIRRRSRISPASSALGGTSNRWPRSRTS